MRWPWIILHPQTGWQNATKSENVKGSDTEVKALKSSRDSARIKHRFSAFTSPRFDASRLHLIWSGFIMFYYPRYVKIFYGFNVQSEALRTDGRYMPPKVMLPKYQLLAGQTAFFQSCVLPWSGSIEDLPPFINCSDLFSIPMGFSFGKSCFKAKPPCRCHPSQLRFPGQRWTCGWHIALGWSNLQPPGRFRGFGNGSDQKMSKTPKNAIPCDPWPWRALHTFWDLKSWP